MADKPKTDEQIAREAESAKLNAGLAGSKHSVAPGKAKGSYQVTTSPLTRKQLDAHLALVAGK